MSRPLKVLIVEDSKSDAELLLFDLRSGGFDPIYERVDTQCEDFLHMVSHDLRSPLTSIRGHAQLLQRRLAEDGDERQQRSAEAVIVSTRRMDAMIQDLADSLRLESGQVSLDRRYRLLEASNRTSVWP